MEYFLIFSKTAPLTTLGYPYLSHMPIAPGGAQAINDPSPTHSALGSYGAGIMEADDRQVITVLAVQPSFQHRHSTNRVS